jgi:hypothetical protein
MNPRMTRAAEAQRAGLDMAIARGDLAEEAARRLSLASIERKMNRAEAWTSETAALIAKKICALDERDGIRRLWKDQHLDIGLPQVNALGAIRLHIAGASIGASGDWLQERVDGGNIHNGQMEGLLDRRRPLRYTLNAAMDAVEDQRLMPVAMEMILFGRTARSACDRQGVTWGGQMAPRISKAILEALDAAVANMGLVS